jgi:hypothetical protein
MMNASRSVLLLAAGFALWHPRPVSGQSLTVQVRAASGEALEGTPVMISVIQDGVIVTQTEVWVGNNGSFWPDPGVYDVRLEGEGVVTLVKRGVTITAEQQTLIGGPLRAGEGLHIVEYATGGFTREELAERLMRLEAAMTSVQEAVEALTEALQAGG